MKRASVAVAPHNTAAASTIQRPVAQAEGSELVGELTRSKELAATKAMALVHAVVPDGELDLGFCRALEQLAHFGPAHSIQLLAIDRGDLVPGDDPGHRCR